ncbi:Tex family protein [Zhaonella formicivorans]|uniref:Tex family protein n=1 Tax=Zhaonella formicivorans TaxID=2528593 RepID=UPI0010E9FF8C|nr:Tex family protein [Zhaonella formicivorans]
MEITALLANEFGLKKEQVENTIKLLDEGNTVPFIARYRKEVTGGLNDEVLRGLTERLNYLRNLEERRAEISRLLAEQGVLTGELQRKIDSAKALVELEDIYRPFRPKRKTRASAAKEKGLEPLAELMLNLTSGDILQEAKAFLNPELGVNSVEEAVQGAQDIIAERVSDDAEVRKYIRELTGKKGLLVSFKKAQTDERSPYEMYYDYQEKVGTIPPHRILAVNRGEKEEFLEVKIQFPDAEILQHLDRVFIKAGIVAEEYVRQAILDGYQRLLQPSLERELRRELTEKGEEQAIKVFAVNLKKLLLQPPCKGQTVLGFDPAYRTGCKLAVVDSTGKVLETAVIYPTPPQNKLEESAVKVKELVKKHKVTAIAIGNGTASRESEKFIAGLLPELEGKVLYTIVNEAGASVYSASKLAQEEFPQLDVTLRSAVSIARRLLDPLAELVKIDPKAIGVGQYQHDVNQKRLGETLQGVVEDCVNSVGVDLNTASPSLLSYVAGVSAAAAKKIVKYREENGSFKDRQELLKVAGLGPKTFEQCAGFLRIPGGTNPLDNTAVHPESYQVTYRLLEELGISLEEQKQIKIEADLPALAVKLGIGLPTLRDIVKELEKPGRDPREDLPPPVFKAGVMEMEHLQPGMVLTGVVRNVVDFGAFVDIGVHQDGLVHISQLSEQFIKNPMEAVNVGDIVQVKILSVDLERKRIALTMKDI